MPDPILALLALLAVTAYVIIGGLVGIVLLRCFDGKTSTDLKKISGIVKPQYINDTDGWVVVLWSAFVWPLFVALAIVDEPYEDRDRLRCRSPSANAPDPSPQTKNLLRCLRVYERELSFYRLIFLHRWALGSLSQRSTSRRTPFSSCA